MFVVRHMSHSKLVKKLRGEGESLIMGCLLNERTQLLLVNHMDTILLNSRTSGL